MEAILACHPARSTEWLDCHPKSYELWRIRTGPIAFLYLSLFHSLLRLTSFLPKSSLSAKVGHDCALSLANNSHSSFRFNGTEITLSVTKKIAHFIPPLSAWMWPVFRRLNSEHFSPISPLRYLKVIKLFQNCAKTSIFLTNSQTKKKNIWSKPFRF